MTGWKDYTQSLRVPGKLPYEPTPMN